MAPRGFFGNPIIAVSVLLAYVMKCHQVDIRREIDAFHNWLYFSQLSIC